MSPLSFEGGALGPLRAIQWRGEAFCGSSPRRLLLESEMIDWFLMGAWLVTLIALCTVWPKRRRR
jgi:hypothetical protein